MSSDEERLRILEMIDSGLITADEGIVLLKALAERSRVLPAATSMDEEDSADLQEKSSRTGEQQRLIHSQKAASEEAPIPEILDNTAPAETAERTASVESEIFTDTAPEEGEPIPEDLPSDSQQPDPSMLHWRRFWWIPLWVGVFITVMGAIFMFLSFRAGGLGFWFACSWFPFMLGVIVLALAWASRSARWLHVRVHQKEGERPQNINISFPIPLRLTAWFVRTFGNRIPNLNKTGLDEVILAMQKTSPDTPFYVQVNEGEGGEKVEVYIG